MKIINKDTWFPELGKNNANIKMTKNTLFIKKDFK